MKLEGVTTRPRHGVVFEVMESVSKCGGAILDHQQYSNQLLRVSTEIRATRLDGLLAGLAEAGVTLSQDSMDDATAEATERTRETREARMAGTLVIRFVSDEPDLRIQTPAVPG